MEESGVDMGELIGIIGLLMLEIPGSTEARDFMLVLMLDDVADGLTLWLCDCDGEEDGEPS